LAAAVAALALLAAPAAVGQECAETQQSARVGAPFEIALPANPSTGYGWRIDKAASAGLELVAIEDRGMGTPSEGKPGHPLVGAPASYTWLITPRGRGSVRLVIDYDRPWETGPPTKTHTFLIDIAGGSQVQ